MIKDFTDGENAQRAKHGELKPNSLEDPSEVSMRAVASCRAAGGPSVASTVGPQNEAEIFRLLDRWMNSLAPQGFYEWLEFGPLLHLLGNGSGVKSSVAQVRCKVLQPHIPRLHRRRTLRSASGGSTVCTFYRPAYGNIIIIFTFTVPQRMSVEKKKKKTRSSIKLIN